MKIDPLVLQLVNTINQFSNDSEVILIEASVTFKGGNGYHINVRDFDETKVMSEISALSVGDSIHLDFS
ncbi:MAG: hypothetical protein WA614_11130 [Acidimicrobiales bacterium]